MSRTFKDQPTWVQVNHQRKHKHLIVEFHNHHRFGREIIQRVPVKVDGETVYEPIDNPRYVDLPDGTSIINYGDYRVKYDYAVIAYYSNECTVDEPENGERVSLHYTSTESEPYTVNTCGHRYSWKFMYPYDSPTVKELKEHHSSLRVRKNQTLRQVAKLYNNDESVDEMVESPNITRTFMRGGIWD